MTREEEAEKLADWARNHRCPEPGRPSSHEFDAACGAVFGMRLHSDEYTDADIVRAVVRELFYIDLDERPQREGG